MHYYFLKQLTWLYSLLIHELGDLIEEIDVNPVKGCVAVDALMIHKTATS